MCIRKWDEGQVIAEVNERMSPEGVSHMNDVEKNTPSEENYVGRATLHIFSHRYARI